MKITELKVLSALKSGFLVLALNHMSLGAAQTDGVNTPQPSGIKIKTNFIEAAQLSSSELSQVLELAKECGIAEPAEVRTFHYLPSIAKGISVKSVSKIEGRNTSFEIVTVNKIGWGMSAPGKGASRNGNFWAEESGKYTKLLRTYEFRKKPVQISIHKDVQIAFADTAISLIASKTVRFENDWARREFDGLGDSKPVAIYQRDSEKGYELEFDEPSIRAIMFKMEKGQLVITGVAHIDI